MNSAETVKKDIRKLGEEEGGGGGSREYHLQLNISYKDLMGYKCAS